MMRQRRVEVVMYMILRFNTVTQDDKLALPLA
jgi:hypothetical protein